MPLDPDLVPSQPPPEARILPIAPAISHCGCRWVGPHVAPQPCVPWWRLLWCDRPGNTLVCADGACELGPDRVVAVPPGLAMTQRYPVRAIYLYLDVTLGGGLDQGVERLHVHRLRADEAPLVERLARIWAARGPAAPGEQVAAVALVGLALADLPEPAWAQRGRDPRVAAAVARMAAASGRMLGNRELAAAVGLGVSRFIHLFTAEMGASPQEWQLRQRLQRAAALLRGGDEPLRSIARRCGFHDRSHLTRHFRRLFGLAPAAWRRQVGR